MINNYPEEIPVLSFEYAKNEKNFPFIKEQNNLYYYFYKEKNDKTYKQFISNFFEIDEVIVDEVKGQDLLKLRINHNGNITEKILPSSYFSSRNMHCLNEAGIYSNPSNRAKDLLFMYVNNQILTLDKVIYHNKIGWFTEDNQLAFYGYDGGYIGNIRLSSSTDNIEAFFNELNSLIAGSIPCQIAVLIGLSSSLIGMLKELGEELDSPIFHFYGDSSTGKSTALVLAVSVWGQPVIGNDILQSWNATSNAIMNTLNNNHGIILALDESSASTSEFTRTVYAISQGIERLRLSKDGSQKSQSTWNTCIISSGENSIINNCRNYTGILARVIEFPNIAITNSAEHSDKIKQFCRKNYGILGDKFVNAICNEKIDVRIVDDYRKACKSIQNRLNNDTSIGNRLCHYYAILALCARYSAEYLSLSVNEDKIVDYLIECNNSLRSETSLYEKAYSYINEWVVANPSAFFTEENTGINKAGVIRNGRAYFFKDFFIDILKKGGFLDHTVVLKALKDNGRLHCEKDRLETRTTINNIKVNCYAVILDCESNEAVSATDSIVPTLDSELVETITAPDGTVIELNSENRKKYLTPDGRIRGKYFITDEDLEI